VPNGAIGLSRAVSLCRPRPLTTDTLCGYLVEDARTRRGTHLVEVETFVVERLTQSGEVPVVRHDVHRSALPFPARPPMFARLRGAEGVLRQVVAGTRNGPSAPPR
jgi:hypothetical protein